MEAAFQLTIFGGAALTTIAIGFLFADEEELSNIIGIAGIGLFFSIPIILIGTPIFLLYIIAKSIKKIAKYS